MAFATPGGKRGILPDVNVVPLIDILLVLLVIFMIIPHRQMGLKADLPQEADPLVKEPLPETIIVQVASDGSLRINQSAVEREELRNRLERIFALRAQRVAFLQGDGSLEFHAVAQVLDLMHTAGASSVGLLTSELEKNR
jgi:biopolymer transport protein ExbD/biopolymer transport protein TolR